MRDPDLTGHRALVTGGLGFLGSSVAIRLVELGAEVTVLDSLVPQHGGNLFNIEPVRERVRLNISDMRDPHSLNVLVRGRISSSTSPGRSATATACATRCSTSR